MKFRILIALLSVNFISPLPAQAALDVTTYIVNGDDVDVDTYPSTVAFFYDSIEYNGYYYSGSFCGGTYLDSTHVLTAAHCFYDSDEARLFAVAVPQLQNESDYPYASYIERLRVSEVYYPDDYANTSSQLYPNDIAIITLEDAMGLGEAITTASNESYRSSSESFIAVGHGNTSTGVDDADSLQAAALNYVDNSSCQLVFTNGDALTDKQICFGGDYSDATGLRNAVCSGDSGGAVYWQDGDTLTQVGITSFGPVTCGDPDADVTSVFTEITDYQSWIDDVLAGNVAPTLTATDAERTEYIATYGVLGGSSSTRSTNNSLVSGASGSGGGSFGGLGMLALSGLWLMRKRHISA